VYVVDGLIMWWGVVDMIHLVDVVNTVHMDVCVCGRWVGLAVVNSVHVDEVCML
jgi:hypothetical protein